jgi:glycosyltransferase involved in cell wall biosynthesis
MAISIRNPTLSYSITHLHLQNLLALPEPPTSTRTGHYHVFWWDQIPLGHFFINQGEKLNSETYHQRVAAAIHPAIDDYAFEQETGNHPPYTILQNYSSWKKWMEKVVAAWKWDPQVTSVPVSVVICTRNRATYVDRAIQSILNQKCLPEEILVIDNAPSDDTSFQIAQKYPQVRYIKEPRPGLDFARNAGARNATCEVVAYADDDVEVHSLWSYRTWQAFQDPAVHGMTGLVIARNLDTEAQVIFEKKFSFNRGYREKTFDHNFFMSSLNKPTWRLGPGANMAFRKSVFEKVGYFDELLDVGPRAAGCDGDSEMYFRVLNGGYTMRYNPRAVSFHEHRKNMKELKRQVYYYYRGWSAAALVQQKLNRKAAYRSILFKSYPYSIIKSVKSGFPNYRFIHSTLWVEMKGYVSGIIFYLKNKNNFGNPLHRSET